MAVGDDDVMEHQLEDFNLLGDLPDSLYSHEFPENISELCVPLDPIYELEWFPNFPDDYINVKETDDDKKTSVNELGGFSKKKKKAKMTKNKNTKRKHLEFAEHNYNGESKAYGSNNAKRMCMHCETRETPLWRNGPMGPNTLCNACGVRFKSGRLLPEYRPLASPTFDASRHSNYHRMILKRRRLNT